MADGSTVISAVWVISVQVGPGLEGEQLGVPAAEGHQLVVGALLGDPPVIHNDDLVGPRRHTRWGAGYQGSALHRGTPTARAVRSAVAPPVTEPPAVLDLHILLTT